VNAIPGRILRLSQCPGSAISLAAFQVSTDGRFWVSAEALKGGVWGLLWGLFHNSA
jgi:hypothetical protein